MAQLLLKKGYRVVGLSLDGVGAPEGIELLSIDLDDPAALAGLPRRWYGVIHLAAASIPSQFLGVEPVIYNLRMTLNLLEHLEVARFLMISSCHVYAPSDTPRKESDLLVPQGRYGLSKHLCEQIIPHYLDKLDIRIVRPFNHLGPGQRAELVIPSLLRRLCSHATDESVPVLMEGMNSVRDFIDVRDVVTAYLSVLTLDDPAERIFNVCTGQGRSIESLVRETLRLLGRHNKVVFCQRPNSSDDIPYLVGDSSRLRATTGWVPEYSLEDSLRSMILVSE